jgi:cobalt/nickel transport system ATP-binding protein
MIKVDSLNFAYRKGEPVIENLSFEVRDGETYGIIGPNGAGKTTILLLIAGLLRGEGRIEVDGLPQPENFKKLRKRIAFLFQNPQYQILMPRVEEELKSQGGDEATALSLAQRFGLMRSLKSSTLELSEGEAKRLALATLLLKNPEYWFLDEPTSNLDPGGRTEIIRVIGELKGTKLIASHDLDLVLEVCDRVLLLYLGRKVVDGNPKELLKDAELLRKHGLDLPLSLRGTHHGKG